MFVSFLMPHVDRGAGPLFHLIMLLQMSRFAPDEICFIGDDAYFYEQHVPFGETLALGTTYFTCVSQERFRAYRKAALPFDAVAGLYEGDRSHLDAFQALLTRDHPPLGAAIGTALDGMDVETGAIEAFLTWSNCPTLAALAAGLKVPVIHNELGPFRGPDYQDTVFFDFQGVNGNTTPATQWTAPGVLAAELEGVPCLTTAALRALLYRGAAPADMNTDTEGEAPVRYPLGVALQVEDDSNTVAYGNGYDTVRLIYRAMRDLPPERILVRSHPGARLGYRGGLGVPDDAPTSLAFLGRIDHLLTINSSVAAEAALWGVPYTVVGDTPFALMSRPLDGAADPENAAPATQPDLALNALFVGYLVPSTLLFDPDYFRWRLRGARLRDCFTRHLEVLERKATHARGALPEVAPATPAAHTDKGTAPYRNPALWSATRSVKRSLDGLTARIRHLETELATAIAARDKNWDERCWFQTNLQRAEQEMNTLRSERDTLRLAVAAQQQANDLALKEQAAAAEARALLERCVEAEQAVLARCVETERTLLARCAETERAMQALDHRFEDLDAQLANARRQHATAEAQNNVLVEELNRTMLERIEALGQAREAGHPGADAQQENTKS